MIIPMHLVSLGLNILLHEEIYIYESLGISFFLFYIHLKQLKSMIKYVKVSKYSCTKIKQQVNLIYLKTTNNIHITYDTCELGGRENFILKLIKKNQRIDVASSTIQQQK